MCLGRRKEMKKSKMSNIDLIIWKSEFLERKMSLSSIIFFPVLVFHICFVKIHQNVSGCGVREGSSCYSTCTPTFSGDDLTTQHRATLLQACASNAIQTRQQHLGGGTSISEFLHLLKMKKWSQKVSTLYYQDICKLSVLEIF